LAIILICGARPADYFLFGETALSTNWLANLFFFIIFVVFAFLFSHMRSLAQQLEH
jgi:hypothetical protein